MGTETAFEVVNAVLSAEPISVDQAIAAVESDTAGAVVSFSGVVRNHDGGKAVERLSYSAHPTAHQVMADVVARLVAEQAAAGQTAGGQDNGGSSAGSGSPQPVRIWAAHRIGMLEIGDPALVCAVSAAHRGQAFAVCSELVDRIKEQVPIWKEQFFTDGSVEWVGAGS
jgi:molybdopterin synthase catalytic subunit